MKNYELPNGEIAEFPDEMSDDEIKGVLRKKFPATTTSPETKESLFKKALGKLKEDSDTDNIVRYGIKDPLIGALNVGSRGHASLHNLAAQLGEKLGFKMQREEPTDFSEMFGIPEEQKNLADRLAQFAPEAAISLALPATRLGGVSRAIEQIPKAGKYLQAALGNALSQGAFAASQSPENQGTSALEAGGISAPFSAAAKGVLSGSPGARMLSRGLLGAGGAGVGYFGSKGLGASEPVADIIGALTGLAGYHGISPKRRAAERTLKGVEDSDYQDVLEAGKRLGLTHISPAEASNRPYPGAVQGTLGTTEAGANKLYEAGQKRLASEETSIENLLKNLSTKELEEKKTALYDTANKQKVPESLLNQFKENEIFRDALKDVRTDSAYKQKLKGVPENSIQYINQIKRAMDGMIDKTNDTTKAEIIRDTKNKMLDKLDDISPEYRQARQLSERGLVKKEIEDLFNKKAVTGTNFFKTFLIDKKEYAGLQNRLKRLEERTDDPDQVKSMQNAQQQLKDMRLVFERLINPQTAKTAEALARRETGKGKNLSHIAMHYLQQFLSGTIYDKAAVDLITNPKWADELEKLKKVTGKEKLVGNMADLFSKAGAQEVAQN